MESQVPGFCHYVVSNLQHLLRFHEVVMIIQSLPAWKQNNKGRDDQGLQVYGVDVYGFLKKEKRKHRLTDWLTIDLCCYLLKEGGETLGLNSSYIFIKITASFWPVIASKNVGTEGHCIDYKGAFVLIFEGFDSPSLLTCFLI